MEWNLEQFTDQEAFKTAVRAAGPIKSMAEWNDLFNLWALEEKTRWMEDRIISILRDRKTVPRHELYKRLRGDNYSKQFAEAFRRLQRDAIVIVYKDSTKESLSRRGPKALIVE